MATQAEAVSHGAMSRIFLLVWLALLGMTGIEVFLAYIHVPPMMMLIALIGLSVVKAALIIAYFMHLKFERFSLFLTLFPMLILCVLLLFIFMPDSVRLLGMRPR